MKAWTEAVAVFFADFGEPQAALANGFGGGPFGHEQYVGAWSFEGLADLVYFGEVLRIGDNEFQLIRVSRD